MQSTLCPWRQVHTIYGANASNLVLSTSTIGIATAGQVLSIIVC
ncbi:MAG TPA: hypothetical protein V6C91_20770 [Coleofasciculaceae cyanobacterium]